MTEKFSLWTEKFSYKVTYSKMRKATVDGEVLPVEGEVLL
jgi:hypothetical protein